MPNESEVVKGIKEVLKLFEFSGVVIWWTRLQSFKIKHFSNWIQGCPKGTPDFIALVRNKERGITVVFIEAKSKTGKLRPEQRAFKLKYDNGEDVFFCEVNDPCQVRQIINTLGIDTISNLPENL